MIQRFRENAKSQLKQNISAFWVSNPFSEATWEADERKEIGGLDVRQRVCGTIKLHV